MQGRVRSRLRQSLVNTTKALGQKLGVEIKRRRNELDEENVIRQLFHDVNIEFVVDVGANQGQYAMGLRDYGCRCPIVSFEALPAAHAALQQNSRSDPRWTIGERTAIGAEAGSALLNVSANSASSSLLPMLNSHVEAAPESSYVGSIAVPVVRLDAVLPKLIGDATRGLLKVDTQGYEDRVLEGASGVLDRFSAIQLEISMAALYEGQASSARLVQRLDAAGFSLGYIITGFRHPNSGRMLQFDGIFVSRRV